MKNPVFALISAVLLASPVLAEVPVAVAPSTTAVSAAPVADVLHADVKVGTGIVDHEPTGVAESFTSDIPAIVAWSRVTGARQPTEVTYVWTRNGDEVARTVLKIQSEWYRTYSRRVVEGLPGNWTVEVQDKTGRVIGSADFNILTPGMKVQ